MREPNAGVLIKDSGVLGEADRIVKASPGVCCVSVAYAFHREAASSLCIITAVNVSPTASAPPLTTANS